MAQPEDEIIWEGQQSMQKEVPSDHEEFGNVLVHYSNGFLQHIRAGFRTSWTVESTTDVPMLVIFLKSKSFNKNKKVKEHILTQAKLNPVKRNW